MQLQQQHMSVTCAASALTASATTTAAHVSSLCSICIHSMSIEQLIQQQHMSVTCAASAFPASAPHTTFIYTAQAPIQQQQLKTCCW